jgi:hypothetical protein
MAMTDATMLHTEMMTLALRESCTEQIPQKFQKSAFTLKYLLAFSLFTNTVPVITDLLAGGLPLRM